MRVIAWKDVGERRGQAASAKDMPWPVISEAVFCRVAELEQENTRLQRLVAELLVKNQRLRTGG